MTVHPIADSLFEAQTSRLLDAIRVCRSHGLTIPALMLLYAIDGMAWCVRKNADGDVTEDDFKAWVENYMFQDSKAGELTAVDLYAARCAMLHSQIAESRKSRHAAAREVHYVSGDGSGLVPVFGLNTPQLPVIVNVDWLFDVLEKGIERFKSAIATDADLKARVDASAAKYLLSVRFGPLPSSGRDAR